MLPKRAAEDESVPAMARSIVGLVGQQLLAPTELIALVERWIGLCLEPGTGHHRCRRLRSGPEGSRHRPADRHIPHDEGA
jgi:hypothetical protein